MWWRASSYLLLLLTLISSVEASDLDVVTMRNGDVHNGNLSQPYFDLQTPYAALRIPYAVMARLQLGEKGESDQIETISGDRFTGDLQHGEWMMLRTLDPELPLDSTGISEITFAAQAKRAAVTGGSDQVIAHNGDIFSARILTTDLLLTGEEGIKLIPASQIATIDLVIDEDDGSLLARVRSTDESVYLGKLPRSQIQLKVHDNKLTLDLNKLSALQFGVGGRQPQLRHLYRLSVGDGELLQDRMRDGRFAPILRKLPGGEAVRGDLQGDGDGDEQPATRPKLKPFAIGLHEVTFQEYDLFAQATGRDRPDDQGWGRGYRPAVNVSWEDAVAYTKWLSQRTGQRYRLPTDAEWEYAARGGTESRFWWGQKVELDMANCEGCGSLWDGSKSAPVGRFSANPFGLHDTAGNVFEWVADCWNDSYADAPEDGSAMQTRGCGKRVIRGGAWSFPPHEIRSANRWRDFPSRSSDDTGFRVARDL
ncbi:MAG: formylglycine-generating enzyme family protein [Chromatiales bacterium]|nr:formylglycine-generating enzyme family protein [Chromatiales bacterium]